LFWKQTPRSYRNALIGRSRGHQERILVLAHQTELMARQKMLKPLGHYLRRNETPAAGAMQVLERLGRAKGVKITRLV